MKNSLFSMALLAAAGFVTASAVPSAFAQGRATMQAQVPFAFHVAGKTLPAGEYRLDVERFYRRVDLTSAEGKTIFLSGNPSAAKMDGVSKLIFHRYGNTYFLRSVVSSMQPFGLDVPESKEEKGIANVAGIPVVVETLTTGGGMR